MDDQMREEELRELRAENEKLRRLGRELFLLADKSGPDEYLTNEEMWRYSEIGEFFAPDQFAAAPQG